MQRRYALTQFMKRVPQLRHWASLAWWKEYQERGVLPFAGGYAEQPAWVLEDFETLDLVYELECIPHDIAAAQKAIADIAARGR
jgi:hypothetical protein